MTVGWSLEELDPSPIGIMLKGTRVQGIYTNLSEGTYPIGSHPTATSLPTTTQPTLFSKCLLLLVLVVKVIVLVSSMIHHVIIHLAIPARGKPSP